jgi:NACHT domain
MTLPDNNLPEPADLQKFFENWWRTGSTIVTTIAAALGSLQISAPANYIIASIVTIAGLGGAILLYRRDVRRRVKAKETEQEIKDAKTTSASAFRGLKRFLRGDTLPGMQRRRQAALLSAQVMRPDFTIAIVTGDSGAGKSSMLESAIVMALEESGHPVVMISNSNRLGQSGAVNVAGLSQIEPVISEIADQISKRRVDGGKPVVLILDQFEELLSRFRNEKDRHALGDSLWKNICEGTRIIVGIRKEYLIEFKFLASRFKSNISFDDTFLIENFDTREAATVILECASRDRIHCDPDLPGLIANDLAVDEKVRPADLQIVCVALSGDLTVERYKSGGRAVGLRSRFLKGVIDVTGDAVLARSVLRQLCDIPNNKKAPEPLRAGDIAEKARAGAPGQRATVAAVTSVLQALEQARVVIAIKIDSATRELWSLIHDYFVEPIKLATEEQNTLAEAATARLDYFVSRATKITATIPLSDLRLIRRDAPPAALKQPATRNLIWRSLLIGYGAPFAGALGVALVAVSLVVFATTERRWQVVEEKNHSDGVPFGKRNDSVTAFVTTLDSRPGKRTVIFGHDWFSPARLTMWDAETGTFLGTSFGSLAGSSIWNYDSNTGHLSEHDATGKEILGIATPQEGRPPRLSKVDSYEDPIVTFDTRSTEYYNVSFNTKSKKWILTTRDKVDPPSSSSNSFSYGSTEHLLSIVAAGNNTSRLTVWTRGYDELLLDEKYEGDFELLGLTDLETRTVLSFVQKRMVNTITIDHSSRETKESAPKFTVGERKQIPIPADLSTETISTANDRFSSDKQAPTKRSLGKRIVIAEPSPKRTIFWIFNPGAFRFDEPIIGAQSVDMRTGYVWMPDDETGLARFWLQDNSEPLRVDGMRIRSNDRIDLSEDKRRLLVISKEGTGDLWDIDFSARKASVLLHIGALDNSNLSMNGDGPIIIRRQPGGFHEIWDRDGSALGNLGALGSRVQTSTYRKDCRQTLVWTSEGQRLDFRRGFNIPLVGFVPERDCSLDMSRTRRLIGKVLARVVG